MIYSSWFNPQKAYLIVHMFSGLEILGVLCYTWLIYHLTATCARSFLSISQCWNASRLYFYCIFFQ